MIVGQQYTPMPRRLVLHGQNCGSYEELARRIYESLPAQAYIWDHRDPIQLIAFILRIMDEREKVEPSPY